jgi:hypothetical protein
MDSFLWKESNVELSVSIMIFSPYDFTSMRSAAEVAAAAAHVAMAPIHENNVGHRMLRYTSTAVGCWLLAGSAMRKMSRF